MEGGFKTYFVLIKLCGGGAEGKTLQILFAHFMNMNYLITLCFAGFMQIKYWQIRTLQRAPRNFLARCILAGNGKKRSICKCWAGGETPARATLDLRAKITRAALLSLLLPAPSVFTKT